MADWVVERRQRPGGSVYHTVTIRIGNQDVIYEVPGEREPHIVMTAAGLMINRLPASLYPARGLARAPQPAAARQALEQLTPGPTGQGAAVVTAVLGMAAYAAFALWRVYARRL